MIIIQSGFELGTNVITACKDEAKSDPDERMDAETEDLSTAIEAEQEIQVKDEITEPGSYSYNCYDNKIY